MTVAVMVTVRVGVRASVLFTWQLEAETRSILASPSPSNEPKSGLGLLRIRVRFTVRSRSVSYELMKRRSVRRV